MYLSCHAAATAAAWRKSASCSTRSRGQVKQPGVSQGAPSLIASAKQQQLCGAEGQHGGHVPFGRQGGAAGHHLLPLPDGL